MFRSLTAAALAFALGSVLPAAAQDAGAERTAARAEAMKKRFERMDRNRDGALDRDEIVEPGKRFFDRVDTNRDGVIDAAETKALVDKRGDRFAKRIQRADLNRDGKVTRDEMVGKIPPWFERADKDRDGKVTRGEYDAFMESRQKKRGEAAKARAEKANDRADQPEDGEDDAD